MGKQFYRSIDTSFTTKFTKYVILLVIVMNNSSTRIQFSHLRNPKAERYFP